MELLTGVARAGTTVLMVTHSRHHAEYGRRVVNMLDGRVLSENVRQLRHDVDYSCPVGPDGKRKHTYDYKEGGCRQAKDCEVTANLGWAMPGTGSAMVMRRD